VSLLWQTLQWNKPRHKLKSQFSLPRRHAAHRFQKIFVIDLAAMSQRDQAIAIQPNTAQTLAVMRCAGREIVIADVSSGVEQGVTPEQWLSAIMECLQLLDYRSDRVRRLPSGDWSWIHRRFLREYSSKLSGDAVFLYLFLCAVADKHGLSYYSDNALALRLRTTERVIAEARVDLLELDLIAYRAPLTQVLSLPASATERSSRVQLRSLIDGLADDDRLGE
jgi:hypothetical protein